MEVVPVTWISVRQCHRITDSIVGRESVDGDAMSLISEVSDNEVYLINSDEVAQHQVAVRILQVNSAPAVPNNEIGRAPLSGVGFESQLWRLGILQHDPRAANAIATGAIGYVDAVRRVAFKVSEVSNPIGSDAIGLGRGAADLDSCLAVAPDVIAFAGGGSDPVRGGIQNENPMTAHVINFIPVNQIAAGAWAFNADPMPSSIPSARSDGIGEDSVPLRPSGNHHAVSGVRILRRNSCQDLVVPDLVPIHPRALEENPTVGRGHDDAIGHGVSLSSNSDFDHVSLVSDRIEKRTVDDLIASRSFTGDSDSTARVSEHSDVRSQHIFTSAAADPDSVPGMFCRCEISHVIVAGRRTVNDNSLGASLHAGSAADEIGRCAAADENAGQGRVRDANGPDGVRQAVEVIPCRDPIAGGAFSENRDPVLARSANRGRNVIIAGPLLDSNRVAERPRLIDDDSEFAAFSHAVFIGPHARNQDAVPRIQRNQAVEDARVMSPGGDVDAVFAVGKNISADVSECLEHPNLVVFQEILGRARSGNEHSVGTIGAHAALLDQIKRRFAPEDEAVLAVGDREGTMGGVFGKFKAERIPLHPIFRGLFLQDDSISVRAATHKLNLVMVRPARDQNSGFELLDSERGNKIMPAGHQNSDA